MLFKLPGANMRSLFLLTLLSVFSSSAFAMTAYKVSVDAVNLHNTGDLTLGGEIMAYLETLNEDYPLTRDYTNIADDQGRTALEHTNSLFIPIESITGNKANIHLKIVDVDAFSQDELLVDLNSVVDLKKNKARLISPTGEYVDITLEKVELQNVKMSLKDYQAKSLNIARLMVEVDSIYISDDKVKEDKEAIEAGAKRFEQLFRIKERILENEGGENYKVLTKAFNDKVLKGARNTLTATDWNNKDFSALPNAGTLLISK
jgi:hypothetical protein